MNTHPIDRGEDFATRMVDDDDGEFTGHVFEYTLAQPSVRIRDRGRGSPADRQRLMIARKEANASQGQNSCVRALSQIKISGGRGSAAYCPRLPHRPASVDGIFNHPGEDYYQG